LEPLILIYLEINFRWEICDFDLNQKLVLSYNTGH